MAVSVFYEDCLPHNIFELESLAFRLGCIDVTAEDMWEYARAFQDPPHLGNVYLRILFSAMSMQIKGCYGLDTDYYINGLDSHFYVNGEKIYSEEDWERILNAYKLEELGEAV